jgi:D-glycero-D-manno-heptose 1,7-bisphosphate phosphatase
MHKLIILDRDGVINFDSPNYIRTPEEWIAIPGSIEAIALLNNKGYKIAIATNQSGIGRGYYSYDTLSAIHNKLFTELNKVNGTIDKLVFCPHTPIDNCSCRKPKPGMLQEILQFFQISPSNSKVYFVGDSATDIAAAKAANCQPVLVRTGNGNVTIENISPKGDILIFDDLLAFAKSCV